MSVPWKLEYEGRGLPHTRPPATPAVVFSWRSRPLCLSRSIVGSACRVYFPPPPNKCRGACRTQFPWLSWLPYVHHPPFFGKPVARPLAGTVPLIMKCVCGFRYCLSARLSQVGARTLLLLLLLRSWHRLFPCNRMEIHSATKPLASVSLHRVSLFFAPAGVLGCRGCWMGSCRRRRLLKAVCCIAYRTSVSCSPQGLVAWESTWLPRTQWSSSTLTGTPRTTCRPRPEPIGLGRRSRSVEGAAGEGFVGLSGCFVKGFFLFSFFIPRRECLSVN